jgi:hypothetical protein
MDEDMDWIPVEIWPDGNAPQAYRKLHRKHNGKTPPLQGKK